MREKIHLKNMSKHSLPNERVDQRRLTHHPHLQATVSIADPTTYLVQICHHLYTDILKLRELRNADSDRKAERMKAEKAQFRIPADVYTATASELAPQSSKS
jgi:hypothetical protein